MTGSISMTEPILYESLPSGFARIVLNRAETRNAQDTAFLYALNDAFDRAAQGDGVKVIVLSANGPHFSSGHDLRAADGSKPSARRPLSCSCLCRGPGFNSA